MLTRKNVESLYKQIEQLIPVMKDILRQPHPDNLFDSESDFRNSEIARKLIPYDYYQIRFFDTRISLKYNGRLKCYYILYETTNKIDDVSFRKTFADELDLDLKRSHLNEANAVMCFKKDLPFERAEELFCEYALYFFYKRMNHSKLFEIF